MTDPAACPKFPLIALFSFVGPLLYYYRARYYDPVLKRFISEDPIGLAGGVNTYTYVGGSPLNYSDPSGNCPWCLAGAGIGAAFNVAVQLANNGGNWNQINIQQVGFAAASGMLGGGLGTVTASLGLGWNVVANGVGSGVISTGLTWASNQLNPCDQQNIAASAVKGALFGAGGSLLGGLYTKAANAWAVARFNNLPQQLKNFAATNAISGPYLPRGTPNWSIGGTATGNAISNTVANMNQ